jgi:hypothetical protein
LGRLKVLISPEVQTVVPPTVTDQAIPEGSPDSVKVTGYVPIALKFAVKVPPVVTSTMVVEERALVSELPPVTPQKAKEYPAQGVAWMAYVPGDIVPLEKAPFEYVVPAKVIEPQVLGPV